MLALTRSDTAILDYLGTGSQICQSQRKEEQIHNTTCAIQAVHVHGNEHMTINFVGAIITLPTRSAAVFALGHVVRTLIE
jgi:hypothetical protein